MRRILFAAATALLLTSSAARADTIDIRLFEGPLLITFGLEPFRLTSPFGFPPAPNRPNMGGTITIVSGPLLGLETDFSDPLKPLTFYTYGPGTFDLEASWLDAGTPMSGGLTTPVDGFSITVCEGCDTLNGGGNARDFHLRPGAGLFDEALARALHVERLAFVDLIELGLEDIQGDPTSPRRLAADHRPFVDVSIVVTAPEPSVLLLGALSAAAFGLRRRWSR